jgi:hypothetical protein
MLELKKPYYVSFLHDPIPRGVDHSKSSPGPGSGRGDRAGYTHIRLSGDGALTFAWEDGPARSDGRTPLYAQSVNVYFHLTDFVVAISSDYTTASCAYNATRRHEFEAHLYRPIRIFHTYRDVMVSRLNTIAIPTRESPRWIRPAEAGAIQKSLEEAVREAVLAVRRNLVAALITDRNTQDDSSHYRVVYDQCSPADWAGKP